MEIAVGKPIQAQKHRQGDDESLKFTDESIEKDKTLLRRMEKA